MSNRNQQRKSIRAFRWAFFTASAILVGPNASLAQGQVIQNCQPGQYVDRTAAGADRTVVWDFSITTDPERCMQIQVRQTVVWSGDFDIHPLAGQGGDMPNPIGLHVNGAVTFPTAGTYGFKCLSHSPMIGAIKVISPTPAPVPALPPSLLVALALLLLASGWLP